MILIRLGNEFKGLAERLRTEQRPADDVKAAAREALRLDQCPCCGSSSLHGHGWRRRHVVFDWWDPAAWRPLWFWRVRCQHCQAVLPIVPDVSLPRLFYGAAVVLAVVVGRVGGAPAKQFTPSARTQRRWVDRFQHWWQIALAAGAVTGPLEQWCEDGVERLRSALWRCARAGIRLVAPSHAPRTTDTALAGRKRPTISAHQRCLLT